MNSHWLKVSFTVLMVMNVALATFLFFQNKGVSSFDDSRLPSVVSTLKNEIVRLGSETAETAQKYSDKASSKLAEEYNKMSTQFEKFKADSDARAAKTAKKIEEIERIIRK